MNGKIKQSFKDNKKYIILFLIIWSVLEIVLIAPVAISIKNSIMSDGFYFSKFIENLGVEVSSFNAIFRIGQNEVMPIFGKCTAWFTIMFSICLIIGMMKTKPKSEYKDIENGSSDWCKNGEQYRILSKNKGIILAENNYLPVDKRGNVNVLVVGGSGSGKSASYSKPNAYQMLGSYVFTDPKGELYDSTAGYLQKNGYEIKVLNLVNPQNSDSYNPLMHITSDIDVDVIAHTIVKGQTGENTGGDPFWDDNAETLLKALIYYLITARPKEEQNLASCAELVRAANNKNGSSVLSELISELPPDHPAVTNYKSIELASDKTYSSILSSLQSKLSKFDSQEIAEVTSTNTIDFAEIANRKTALYVISSDTHTAYNFLLTIFFSQLIQQVYNYADENGGRLKVPLYFILDEFANIGQIPDFDKKISTSRSRGISFSVILQNLDQLEAVYEKSYETIMGNCDTHVFLGSNSFKTVEYFSKQLGEKTIFRDTKSVSRDKDLKKQGTSTSDQNMARALMTPDELRRMDNDLCIIFEKGLKPIKAKKYYYFEKPMYKQFNAFTLNHNNFDIGDRGTWRKFNPNNPYYDSSSEPQKEVKIESLDDLWDDNPKTENSKEGIEKLDLKEDKEAPILPMEPNSKEDELFTKDLQKELEAKFDELFGPIENNTDK